MSTPEPSLARVRAMLDPKRLDREPDDSAGYLDLLGTDASPPRTAARRAMRSDLLAAVYQRWWRPGLTAVLGLRGVDMSTEYRDAVRALRLGGEQRVLDVACGPGNFTRVFAEALTGDGLAVGLDDSPAMLARAVADNSVARAGYLRADARRLPFPDASFDAVCCYAALYLVPEPFTVLWEMLRVLAPGGRIALMTSCQPGWEPLRAACTATGWIGGIRMFGRDEITGILRAAGLTEINQQVTGLAQYVSAHRAA